MKPRILERIQHRLRHTHANPTPPPSDDAAEMHGNTRRERIREWLAELSEDLANIDRGGKGPPRSH